MKRMDYSDLLKCLRDTDGIPFAGKDGVKRRMVYESGIGSKLIPSGRFFVDFSASPGGTTREVPSNLIHFLEGKGVLVRCFGPEINAWILAESQPAEEPSK